MNRQVALSQIFLHLLSEVGGKGQRLGGQHSVAHHGQFPPNFVPRLRQVIGGLRQI